MGPLLNLHHRDPRHDQLIHQHLGQLPTHNLQPPLLPHREIRRIETGQPFPALRHALQAIPPDARLLPLERPDGALESIAAGEPAGRVHGEGLSVEHEIDRAGPGVEGYGRDDLSRAGRGDFDVRFAGPACGPGVAD